MNKYIIEQPTENDFDEIVILWERSVRATHTFLKEQDLLLYKQLLRDKYLLMVDLYCIRLGSVIAGFVGVAGNSIEMLFVSPAYFSMGVGRALTIFSIDSLNCITVDVNEQNTKALSFYEKSGFKTFGRSETDGLGKPYPLLHMRLG